MNRIRASLLTLVVAAFGFASYAQEEVDVENYNLDISDVQSHRKQHHVKITLLNGYKLKGVVTSIGDESIQFEKVIYKNYRGDNPVPHNSLPVNEVNYGDIQDIKIRPTFGERIVGFFAGTAVGVVVGGLGGLSIPCEDCDAEDRLVPIVFLAGLGAAILGPIGAISGMKDRIDIEGQHSKYQKFKVEIEDKE